MRNLVALAGEEGEPVPTAEITDNDVLCGRGGDINSHPGNERFRKIIDQNKLLYLAADAKREKRIIASSIVEEVHSWAPRGRFLSKIQILGGRRGRRKGPDLGWIEIDDDKAIEKTSQALRENAPLIRREIKQNDPSNISLRPGTNNEDPDDEALVEDAGDGELARQPQQQPGVELEVSLRGGPQQVPSVSQESMLWDSVKDAAAAASSAASSMISSCTGYLGQVMDTKPKAPPPSEHKVASRPCSGSQRGAPSFSSAHRVQAHQMGARGYILPPLWVPSQARTYGDQPLPPPILPDPRSGGRPPVNVQDQVPGVASLSMQAGPYDTSMGGLENKRARVHYGEGTRKRRRLRPEQEVVSVPVSPVRYPRDTTPLYTRPFSASEPPNPATWQPVYPEHCATSTYSKRSSSQGPAATRHATDQLARPDDVRMPRMYPESLPHQYLPLHSQVRYPGPRAQAAYAAVQQRQVTEYDAERADETEIDPHFNFSFESNQLVAGGTSLNPGTISTDTLDEPEEARRRSS